MSHPASASAISTAAESASACATPTHAASIPTATASSSVSATRLPHSRPAGTRPSLAERSPLLQRLLKRSDYLSRRAGAIWMDDAGMSTVEYAIGTIGAAAFGAVLIAVVKSDGVQQSLLDIIQQALSIR